MTDSLRRQVDDALREALASREFTPLQDGVFSIELVPEIRGWVGIGLATEKRGGEVDADPMVGVRYEPVEKIVRSSASVQPTVIRPLYELIEGGEYQTWSFNERNLATQAEALAEALVSHAIPFFESLTTVTAIEEALRSWSFADRRRTRLPALLLAQGDEEGARAAIERETALLETDGDQASLADYETFAAQLLAGSDPQDGA